MSAVRSLPDDDMFTPVDAAQLDAEEAMDKWAVRKTRSRGISERQMCCASEEVARMMREGSWEGAGGKHFVGAYEVLYERVYGVAPETSAKERLVAVRLANKLLAEKFDGDPNEMALFVRWVWVREEGREKWRRENGRSGGVVSFAWQFDFRLYGEWRVDQMRHKG